MHLDNHPISCHQLGRFYQLDGKQLQQQYKHHISDYKDWDQREHADQWMLFAQNMGAHLSIDETALSNELYTVITNKAAKGLKGAIVAMIKGMQARSIFNLSDFYMRCIGQCLPRINPAVTQNSRKLALLVKIACCAIC